MPAKIEWAIDAIGPSCRLLVTTRLAALATGSGAASLEIRELSGRESSTMMAVTAR